MIFRKKKHPNGTGQSDAEQARRGSESRLEATKRDWPKVREVTKSLDHMRRTNHFAELIERAMRHTP